MSEPILKVENLEINFHADGQTTEAVKGISFSLHEEKVLAVVGESGSGKSVTAMSITRLLPEAPVCQVRGSINFMQQDMLTLKNRQLRDIRGKDIAYIFQEPGTSLNPVFSIGSQIAEVIKLHRPEITDVKAEIVRVLDLVGIHDAEKRIQAYPHELSGGMQQRVMIAMALACHPKILIADEPTTALDVTIQKQIIDLLKELKTKLKMSIILITHNFGIIKGFADDVIVMFRGKIVESGPAEKVLQNPQHPYTQALIECIPRLGVRKERLTTIQHEELEKINAS
ncbi:MAG: ABC transporter ATP-binding protein [Verrucomicrobiota bacterium]